MMASFQKYILHFIKPSGTSRGILHTKETYFLHLSDQDKSGVGECALFRGLSYDDVEEYERKLIWLCENIHLSFLEIKKALLHFPSIWMGYEQAMLNLTQKKDYYFQSDFTEKRSPITINGLIWMGNSTEMKKQIVEKLDLGFHCLKLKIGVNWEEEYQILVDIRKSFSKEALEIRVDANGAFSYHEAFPVLEKLAQLNIHSIEQPIKANQIEKMGLLCKNTPTPIALDEELIGILTLSEKKALLENIQPQYIILKPSLVGGFSGTDEWIELADTMSIPWWITSALESNIGLNAIAQYTFTKNNAMPQGLGTGALYSNNLPSALELKSDKLYFKKT